MTLLARRPLVSRSLVLFAALAAGGCLPQAQQASEPKRQKILDKPRLPTVPPPAVAAIDPALQRRASAEIAAASNAPDPVTRAQALEATSRTRDLAAAPERIARGLADNDWLVRFAAAMCAGDLKVKGSYNALLAAATDKSPSVRVAVRYALHQLGDTSRSKDLESLSQNPDPRVRGNVAFALGLLGEPTATRVVRPLLADADAAVRMQAAEALWRLGDEQGLNNLVAGTISAFPDEQIVCILALAGPRDQRVKEYVLGKLAIDKDDKQYAEVQLAAARTLGMLGSDAGVRVALDAAASQDPRQRALAALALGDIGRADAQPALGKLLADTSADVRLGAAVALRQLALKTRA